MNEPEGLHLLSVSALLDRAADHLAAKYTGMFAAETVEATVHESHDLLATNAAIRLHVPNLAVHFAADHRLTGAYPKPLTDEVVRAADAMVTMGCGRGCLPDLPRRALPRPDPARSRAPGRSDSACDPRRDRRPYYRLAGRADPRPRLTALR